MRTDPCLQKNLLRMDNVLLKKKKRQQSEPDKAKRMMKFE